MTIYFMRKSRECGVRDYQHDEAERTIGFDELCSICIVIVEWHDTAMIRIENGLDIER